LMMVAEGEGEGEGEGEVEVEDKEKDALQLKSGCCTAASIGNARFMRQYRTTNFQFRIWDVGSRPRHE